MPRRSPQKIVAVGTLPNRDPHDLLRFVRAQNAPAGPEFSSLYDTALGEILNQRKTQACQWLDCVLPRLRRPGKKTERMSLRSMDEARAFMELPVLGTRLLEICEAMVLSEAECPVGLLGSRANAAKAYSSIALFAGINEKVAALQGRLSGLFKGFQADEDAEIEENNDKEGSAPPQNEDACDARVSPDSLKRKRNPESGGDGRVCKKNRPSPAERPEGGGNDGEACKNTDLARR